MRPELRHLLTPRMIQSMEILQLPAMALEERIEEELQTNPVLEEREPDGSDTDNQTEVEPPEPQNAEDQDLVLKEDGAEDFDAPGQDQRLF